MASSLHLPSLAIENFRGIRSLRLPQLGRVTLLAGKNGVGKTTVLEAVRLFAWRGDFEKLFDLLDDREEYTPRQEEGETDAFSSLFHQAHVAQAPWEIRIGNGVEDLRLFFKEREAGTEDPYTTLVDEKGAVLTLAFGKQDRALPASREGLRRWHMQSRRAVLGGRSDWPNPIPTETLGPALLENKELARLWDVVALTESEDLAVQALGLVVGEDVARLTVVGNGKQGGPQGRRALVRLKSSDEPVPLKRLGDGAHRMLAISLALSNCRDGILLIDEAENGLHYSTQTDMWRMIFCAAADANVQVVAATHSWDCIAGFANAAVESEAEGILYRLDDIEGELHAVRYPEEDLEVAARQRIEVR